MSMAHAFAALGIGAAGSAVTYYLVTRSSGDAMPEYVLVSKHEQEKAEYTGKVGETYKDLLVSTKEETKNKSWWEWSFKRWKADFEGEKTKITLGAEFADNTKVKTAFAKDENNDSTKALNRVCRTIYGKNTTDLGNENEQGKRKEGLWKYCSPVGAVPKTVNDVREENYSTNNLGEKLKAKVLSVKSQDNGILWNLKNAKFLEQGSAAPTNSEKFFKKRHEEAKKGIKTLQKICEEAYGKVASSSSGEDTPVEAEVTKFCTLEGK